MPKSKPSLVIDALKVPQWLEEWNQVDFNNKAFRRRPEQMFFQFSIAATQLKALCGVYPRSTNRKLGAEDVGIQRRHEVPRSEEIARFVRFGYPWSDLSEAKRRSGEYNDLQKPGWLPTAIVVNILRPEDKRQGKTVNPDDLVKLETEGESRARVILPKSFTGANWRASSIPPIEVIDGQHRLWAFEGQNFSEHFHLPVVAFFGLDLSWQAYLFYTINIKPKKINASLAFDLYPLLRTEDWLEKFEGHIIYRETRAQELVDLLWSHPKSPWYQRINMLGETARGRMVTQAAWIRSLLATFIKSWEGKKSLGGLFGAPVGSHQTTLPWSRAEQAAFLMYAGTCMQQAISSSKAKWAHALREAGEVDLLDEEDDQAFYGPKTLINQDQGIRAFLHVVNDLCYVQADELELNHWGDSDSKSDTAQQVADALRAVSRAPVGSFLRTLAKELSTYDWRASEAPGLSEDERLRKAAFRGSGGYKELRRQILLHLCSSKTELSKFSRSVMGNLGYI